MTAQVYCLLTAVLLCLSGYLSTTDATQSKPTVSGSCPAKLIAKPGVCPPEKLVGGSCAKSCTGDFNCLNNEKCCSNGSGRCCTAPCTVKPGRCSKPKIIPMYVGSCSYDCQCPGTQKCCPVTGGHACSEPYGKGSHRV